MPSNALNLQIVVDNSGLVSGLTVATKGVDGAAQSMRQSLKLLGDGAKEASEPVKGLGDKIKEFASEERSQGRLGSFLARQIGEIGIAGHGAAGEIAGFVSAFAYGGGIGVAIEGVKLLFKAFSESGGEVKKATTEAIEAVTKLHEKVEEYLASLRNESEVEKLNRTIIAPLKEKEAAEIRNLTALTDDLAIKQTKLREAHTGGMELLAMKGAVELAKERLANAQKLLDTTQIQLHAEEELVKQAGQGKAEKDRKEAREQEALDLAQWRAFQLQEWKKYYDAQTADAAKALQDQFAALDKAALEMAKFRAEQFQEDHKHYEKVTADTLATLQGEADKEIKLAKEKARAETEAAKQFGDAFGAAFAGIVSGTESVSRAFASMASAAIKAVIDVAIKTIQANAVAAAAEAATSQAGIPIIGPILAIAALASMESLISGLLYSVPSAAVGGDIPLGINPLIQAHQGEAILPRPTTDGVNEFLAAWRAGELGGGDSYHFNFPHAVVADESGIRRLVESGAFRRATRESRRNGIT